MSTTPLFPVHTLDSAPNAAKPSLQAAAAAFGFVPNIIGVMAASPALAEAYLTLSGIFERKTDLSPTERQVVLLTVSRYHECGYCVAAHSMAASMQDVPAQVVEAIRSDSPIPDVRLEALRQLVSAMMAKRGWLTEDDVARFLAAGYTPGQLFDVLVGVAQKVLSNFTNHLADTPLDEPFSASAWSPVTGSE
ncbi:MAG: carboxymuconolactone decarboxylase family protein [Chromatiales bacterium]|nr:carboxymuconolactone decarboxylase family protein [Chromatiales bacterium]